MMRHFTAAALCFAALTTAQAARTEPPQPIETFTPPSLDESTDPRVPYPHAAAKRNREGWVHLNYMVDPAGKAYDVTVARSSGNRSMERHAISTVKRYQHNPAMLNGTPIDASTAFTARYGIWGGLDAKRKFKRNHEKFKAAIARQDQAEAEVLLKKLGKGSRNLFEESLFHLATYEYANLWGTTAEQFDALRTGLWIDEGFGYLPSELVSIYLPLSIRLAIRENKLIEAASMARKLSFYDSGQGLIEGQRYINQIAEKIVSEEIISSRGRVREDDRYFHYLARRVFGLQNIDGDVAELRLHCDKGYVGFIYKEDTTYYVNEGWDECGLVVIGTPGSTFQIIEYPGS